MKIFEITFIWVTIAPTYYWLMYVLWFIIWIYIIQKRWIIQKKYIDNLFLYIFLWVILWWRFWYVLFYNFSSYISDPLSILKIWEWWMSFHGWVIWVIIAMLLFSRKFKINFYKLSDQITLVLPIWIWLWRIWNYLNWELLWYSPYTWIFAINWQFPSPLIEFLLEWIILFLILNYLYLKKNLKKWQIACLFLIFYSLFRIIVEIYFRIPDAHIWYILEYFTIWEILSLPMFLIWIFLYKKIWK